MALIPDKSRLIYTERNVDAPDGNEAEGIYDLALYPELGRGKRGVLVVTMIVNFKFENGFASDKNPEHTLTWSASDKKDFMDRYKAAVAGVWGEKHRVTTTSELPVVNDVGVILDIQTNEGMSVFDHSHWNATVKKVDAFTTSSVTGTCCGSISNGSVELDSEDLTPVSKRGPELQRGAVHEFGHMLGYRDEYAAADANKNWLGDLRSIMNAGETIQPRHYVFFADWITNQYTVTASLLRASIAWKVNGTLDLAHARL